METKKTVNINGRLYDAATGLPVQSKPARETVTRHATDIHASTQKSTTLHRRAAKKKPAMTPVTISKRPQPGRHMDIARSNKIAKFAPHPVTTTDIPNQSTPDKPTTIAAAVTPVKKAPQVIAATPKQIKESAIAEALAKPNASREPHRRRLHWTRRASVAGATVAVLFIAGYVTYLNMPGLSVGIASAQAGISASYPKYQPDGYSLAQPITYKDGEVAVTFTSNSGSGEYAITQTKSSWDSSAVLDNIVRRTAGDNYITTQERGLTIYSYDNAAVWVNGGIMYKIAANAPLSGDQIRRIAVSL